MPLVRVTQSYGDDHELPYRLRLACEQIVPAAFNCSGDGRLTPGSIRFFCSTFTAQDEVPVDVFVDIEAYDFPERADNLDARTNNVMFALKELFPDLSFDIWPKLVKAGWATDVPDPDFEGDLSMEAAMDRARAVLSDLDAETSR